MEEDPGNLVFFLLFFLFFLSGFFSAAEVALVSISPAKARSLLLQKKSGAKKIQFLKNHPEKLLITILIGNNLVNIVTSVLSTVVFTKIFGNEILGILTGILTILILIFGEIIPKSIAQKNIEICSRLFAFPIFWLSRIFFPIVWPLEKMMKIFDKSEKEKIFEEKEFIALAEIGEKEGELDKGEKERIKNVLEFEETTAENVMTPRTKVEAIRDNKSLESAVRFFLEKTHSRIPVFSGTIDNIVGILTLKDIFEFREKFSLKTKISQLPQKKALRVPISMNLENIFRKFQQNKNHIAIVIDEHGGTAGIVTLEDLVEEIFGEIHDETDREDVPIRKISEKIFSVLGNLLVEEIVEETGIFISGDQNSTIARKILKKIGRFPNRGEKIEFENFFAFIEKASDHQIEKIRIIKK